MTKSFLAILVIVPGIAAGRWGLATLAASHVSKPAEALPISVRVVEVAPEVVGQGLKYSAVVKELQKAELSFRVSGTLEHLLEIHEGSGAPRPVHEGDRLRRGTVLARLDPADFLRDKSIAAERLEMATSRLAQAESDVELARAEFRRTEQLLKRGTTTESQMDTDRARLHSTEAALTSAKRDVASSRVSLEQAEANLGYCAIHVPFEEATVAERHIDNYQRVSANQAAFLLLDLTSVLVAFRVPDTQVSAIRLGRPVKVTIDAKPGEAFTGVVHKIGSSADPQTRTYPVEVRIDHPEGLRPGMIAVAHLQEETREYLLPLTSVVPTEGAAGETAVYRVTEERGESVARKVTVVFGDVIDNRVSVRVGKGEMLQAGDKIVSRGLHRLHDGQAIRVIE